MKKPTPEEKRIARLETNLAIEREKRVRMEKALRKEREGLERDIEGLSEQANQDDAELDRMEETILERDHALEKLGSEFSQLAKALEQSQAALFEEQKNAVLWRDMETTPEELGHLVEEVLWCRENHRGIHAPKFPGVSVSITEVEKEKREAERRDELIALAERGEEPDG